MLNVLKALWRARVSSFLPIWLTVSIAAVAVTWMVTRAGTPRPLNAGKPPDDGDATPEDLHSWRAMTWLALAMLVVFLAGYTVLSVLTEKFSFYDDLQLTLYSLRGLNFPPPIWRESGRFFPLGLQEFNLLKYFTRTTLGFHGFVVAQLLVLSCALLLLDDELSVVQRAMLVPALLCAPGIVIAYTGLIYPERDVVFCLVCLLLCVKRFERTQSPVWAAIAAGCAQIMLYEKETGSLLLLAFALTRLLLRWWTVERAGGDRGLLRTKEGRLDLCLVTLSVSFLLYYLAAMFPHPNMRYAVRVRVPLGQLLRSYLKLDFLVWIFAAVLLVRAYGILRRRIVPSPLWDALGFGGLACFCAYIYLGIFRAYYLATVEAIAVLYVGRFLIMSWKEMRAWTRVAAAGMVCAVAIQFLSLSAFHILERQNHLRAKAEIARVVQGRYWQGTQPVRLYFPFSSPWQVMEFGYHLNLQGVPIEDGTLAPAGKRNPVVLIARTAAKDGRCVEFWEIQCRAGSSPETGDLIIVLPDDNAQLSEVIPYREAGEPLLAYEVRPAVPKGFYPFIRLLGVASLAVAHKDFPDRWMDASVTLSR